MSACHRPILAGCTAVLLLMGCASVHSDRFHTLQPIPSKTTEGRSHFSAEVSLHVGLPSLIDRNELVLLRGKDVAILEHDRWAAPLPDQMASVLGRNIEQRRPDLLIALQPRSPAAGAPRISIRVEVVSLALHQDSGDVELEARWQIHSPAVSEDQSGRGTFAANAPGGAPTALTHALSECLGKLSDQIIQQVTMSSAQP